MANTKNKSITVVSHRRANIAVIAIVSVAALILVAIAVLSMVHVEPLSEIKRPVRYEFYDLDSTGSLGVADSKSQSKIRTALDGMDFAVMTAMLQGKWDYSYNFIRNKSDKKIKINTVELGNLRSREKGYLVEYVYDPIPVVDGKLDYSKAQKLTVDGETVYYDRIKMFITDSNGKVGTIRFYPYIYARLYNNAFENEELSYENYEVTGVTVRADTTDAYAALKKIAADYAGK